jgi:hypothetical protein
MRENYKTKVNDTEIDITVVYHGDEENKFAYEVNFTDMKFMPRMAWIYKTENDPKCNQAIIRGKDAGAIFDDIPIDINEINKTFSPLLISTSYTWLTTNINNSVSFPDFMEHTVNIKVYSV